MKKKYKKSSAKSAAKKTVARKTLKKRTKRTGRIAVAKSRARKKGVTIASRRRK